MPNYAPPKAYTGTPAPYLLPAGTRVWRVHARAYPATAFNSHRADMHFGGSRFDATDDDPYPYLYVASRDTTALTETLVRGLPFGRGQKRILQRKAVSGRRLCALETMAELRLISLISSPDLAAVLQDEWLVQADPRDYAFTRRWAHWLHQQVPWAQGLVWGSRRDLGELSIMLFGDRCPGQVIQIASQGCRNLDDAAGAVTLNSLLAPYSVHIYPPRGSTVEHKGGGLASLSEAT